MRLIIACFMFLAPLTAQTLAEKKGASREGATNGEELLPQVNKELTMLRKALEECYGQVARLHSRSAGDTEFQALLEEVNVIKSRMLDVEKQWMNHAVAEGKKEDEDYALWDQEETTLTQVVMEYGAMDHLYVIPAEMASMKLHMYSGIPIPRESWPEMLEMILAQSGIGVKKINSYARQLFIFKQDPSAIVVIASRPEDLPLVPSQTRLFYLFSPPVEQVKSVFQFFEKFADIKQTFLHQVGAKIAIISSKEEVEKLLALYNTVWQGAKGKASRVIPVTKISVREMEKILQSFFGEAIEKARPPFGKVEQEGLSVFPLGSGGALVLIGQKELVDRAEKVVKETEEQLQDPAEMTAYLYTCRHSDPVDLGKVLEKVYASLVAVQQEGKEGVVDMSYMSQGNPTRPPDGYPPAPPLVVAPPPLKAGVTTHLEIEKGSDHFIPDPKTGTLLMVVRKDALAKIKDLLRKLDIPKKMVQIEVLLFEKQLNHQTTEGLNLLKLGTHNGFDYSSVNLPGGHAIGGAERRLLENGILEFFFTHAKSNHFPAYDITYNFMMQQEDIQLNAAPSVITVNQTPATISIVDEISINNGAAPVDTNKGIAFEKSFSRTQYGITIVMTPTVHVPDLENNADDKGLITLQTNITFDTPRPNSDDRPLVNRRHIENEVRVVDGQTVIIGGLRKRATQDTEDKVPFLGDIPGLGKLFGSNKLIDQNTEMFFFITPTIIENPEEQFNNFRAEQLKKRPGDVPEFMDALVEARRKERKRFMRNSFRTLLTDAYRP
jgi:general secretion pathway protein D